MNENARKAVEELKTTTKRQGTSNLHVIRAEGDEFCCMGIFCELAAKAGIVTSTPPVGFGFRTVVGYSPVGSPNNVSWQFPPVEVADWLGMRFVTLDRCAAFRLDQSHDLPYAAQEHFLPYLNDDKRLSFKQIAEHIENHQDIYFLPDHVKNV